MHTTYKSNLHPQRADLLVTTPGPAGFSEQHDGAFSPSLPGAGSPTQRRGFLGRLIDCGEFAFVVIGCVYFASVIVVAAIVGVVSLAVIWPLHFAWERMSYGSNWKEHD